MKLFIFTSFIIAILSCFILFVPTDIKTMLMRLKASHEDNQYFKTKIIKGGIGNELKRKKEMKVLDEEDIKILTNEFNTYSFIVMKDNEIITENYFKGYNVSSKFNPFSSTKSIVSILIGIAVDNGYIKSIDEPINKYIPKIQLKNTTIRNVLQMSSGIGFTKNHWLLDMGMDYFASNLTERVLSIKEEVDPGKYLVYHNMNTQILSMVLERATSMRIDEFAHQKLWKHLGVNDAEWCIDNTNNIKAYCCYFITTEDFLKFGELILSKGSYRNKTIISNDYLIQMFTPNKSMLIHHTYDKPDEINEYYGLQAWTAIVDGIKLDYFSGIHGQLMITIPQWNVAIARFGDDLKVNKRPTVVPLLEDIIKIVKKKI